LCDGVSGDEMDEQEDEAYYQPDDWEGVEDALEEGFQLSVLGSQFSVFSSRFSVLSFDCHRERS
jgi:hypothetical protein